VLDKNWKSFFASIKDWKIHPEKYLGRPKLPKYKHKENGRFNLILTNKQFKIKDDYIFFSWNPLKPLNNLFKTKVNGKLMQIRFIPKLNNYVMEIVYEIKIPELNIQNNNIASIDIGINNLATIGNTIGLKPIIINGRPLKSINQFYNKEKARLQSDLKLRHNKNWSNKLQQLTDKRNNKIKDYMHKSTKEIINWCIKNNIDTLIVGKNINWKQGSKMSKKVNQNFVNIPHAVFIEMLQYKCENIGINFIETEESYTSGTSFLDRELPIKENYDKTRRIYRGLFKTKKGELINADLNGAYQIMKKVFPKINIENPELHPKIINIA